MLSSTLFKGVLWFIVWTVFSFLAHLYARKTLTLPKETESLEKWIMVALLTMVQLLFGAISLKLYAVMGDKGFVPGWNDARVESKSHNGNIVGEGQAVEPCYKSLYLSHALATMATNASIMFVNTGSAFTIKAFEPITTAVLTSMLLGTKLETHAIISLPLVVSGALGFVWKPTLQSSATFGLGMAFVSNILFGIRNINLKLVHKELNTTKTQLDFLRQMSLMAAGIMLFLVCILSPIFRKIPTDFNITTSMTSGFFHITYTIVSTCVILRYTSVVGHATCNLLKRILVAAAFYAIGRTVISTSNWVMGLVMLLGLLIYTCPSRLNIKDLNPSLSLITVMSATVILLSILSPTMHQMTATSHAVGALQSVQSSHLDLSKTIVERENELVGSINNNANALPEPGITIKDPTKANLWSIKTRTTTDLITEAYRLHQEVFTHIIGRYKRAVLVNVFQWFNKGDHLITIGQRKILQRMGIELVYHCYYPGRDCNFKAYTKPDPDMIVLIQGAGYIGHPSHEFVISNTLKHFPDKRVMVFPISVCHPTPPCTEIVQFNEIFKLHKDVHIVFRDRYSYDLAQQYFETTKNYLAPDSAFAVGNMRMNIVPIYDIIWLKRDDWESQKDEMPKFPSNITVQVTDWDDKWMNQKSDNFWEDHQLRTMTGVSFLARAKVVVSDRLHAHIMSQLMGKPNVVINSETKKQEHYYMTWEQSVQSSALVNTNTDALVEALRLLKKYENTF